MSEESEPIYEKIIYENEAKGYQLRLVINEFRDEYYLHLRKYFMSYDMGYMPSKEGVSMVAELDNIYSLLDGLIEICAIEESNDAITRHFAQRIFELENSKQQLYNIGYESENQ